MTKKFFTIIIGSIITSLVFWQGFLLFRQSNDLAVLVDQEVSVPTETPNNVQLGQVVVDQQQEKGKTLWAMKNVPVTTSIADLQKLKDGGIDIVTTEWGIGSDPSAVETFMQQTQKIGLQVVVDGGFSPAAWGYDASYDGGLQEPQWQSEVVRSWVRNIKDYTNVYAYDINNEFGENLPVPAKDITDDATWREKYAIKKEQLRIVRDDVHQEDATRPLVLRMRQWDTNSDLFVLEDHFEKDLVEIVMLNLYTNWVWDGYNPDEDPMIEQKAQVYIDAIHAIDPDVDIWISLAAFADEPYFRKPSSQHVRRDVANTFKLSDTQAIAFFGLGYENAPSWYLFRDGLDLWQEIIEQIATKKEENESHLRNKKIDK